MTEVEAHRHFSTDCFNRVWTLLEKVNRSPEEDRLMREMAHASLYHWLEREDGTALQIATGLWQVARVYSVLGDGTIAMRYAEECLAVTQAHTLPAFFQGCAYECAARAAITRNDPEAYSRYHGLAEAELPHIEDPRDLEILRTDLQRLAELAIEREQTS